MASPFKMPAAGWKHALQNTWHEASEDNIGMAAAGVAFYGFLALVPLLGAIVLTYGLVADPNSVIKIMKNLTSVMPGDAARLIGEQLMNVVKTSGTKKGFGLLLALGLALFGARSGAGSIITGLNIAYEEKETRSFFRLNLLALSITVVGVVVAIIALVAVAALGHLEQLVPGAPWVVLVVSKVVSYLLVALGGAAGAATLYRYAPNHADARWVWLTPGSVSAAGLWVALTIGFGIYVADFGKYNATYGSLGAVVVMLTWFYLSSYALLLGAEFNAELEKEARRKTAQASDRKDAADDSVSSPQPIVAPSPARPDDTQPKTARAGRVAAFGQVGIGPSLLATSGLALLKRRERAAAGAVLLAASGLLAFLIG